MRMPNEASGKIRTSLGRAPGVEGIAPRDWFYFLQLEGIARVPSSESAKSDLGTAEGKKGTHEIRY